MLRNFLTVECCFLLLLLLRCVMCHSTPAAEPSQVPQNTIALFEPNKPEFVKSGEREPSEQFDSFTSPSFSYVGGVMSVFASAKKNGEGNKKCDIVEGYFDFKNKLTQEIDKGIAKQQWTKRVITKNEKNCTESPTAVVNEDKNIFMFFKNCSDVANSNWEYKLIDGTVNNIQSNNGITWKDSATDLTGQLKTPEGLKDISSIASGGAGIVVNKNLAVPVWYTQNSNDFVSIITNTNDTSSKKEWKLVVSNPPLEGIYPSIVEWGNKLIMMISDKKGYRKVYESDKMGTDWTEAKRHILGVWGNTEKRTSSKDGSRYGFITADIDGQGKKVILVTQPVKETKYKLHLWMTDYRRVFDVGAISAESDQSPSSTLLYAENNLFVAYERGTRDKSTINIKHLKDELNKIKEVYGLWTTQDGKLSKSCFADDLTIKEESCGENNKISTDGLVGFLSGNYSSGKWGDEYWCVNATVRRGTNVSNGLQFSGAGAGAMWPVSEQGQNEPYHFSNNEFTLMATVRIDGDANNNNNSILGIALKENSDDKRSIGLWCRNGKWFVTDKKNTEEETQSIEKTSVKDGMYHVALILNQNTLSVYIGNQKNGKLPESRFDLKKPLKITHFYFGANTGAQGSSAAVESHVTVTNVFLYNRPFISEEINKRIRND